MNTTKKRPLGLKLSVADSKFDPTVANNDVPDERIPDRIVKVGDNVFLSGVKAASNLQELLANKIDVIVGMVDNKDMLRYPEHFEYMVCPIMDNSA